MVTVYKRNAIPKEMQLITLNDVFFNRYALEFLDDGAAKIINDIDGSEMVGISHIMSKFDGGLLNIDKLSTGCKVALNVFYNPDKVFDIRECGDNALNVIYGLSRGNIYCEYPFVSFKMTEVRIVDKYKTEIVCNYEELVRWWKYEN